MTKSEATKQRVLGMSQKMSNGMIATIIKYRNANDLDIKWENGEIQNIKSLAHFREGKIAIASKNNTSKALQRIGESRIMNCGLKATIVQYNKAHDISIQWDDGLIQSHKYYTDFINGTINYPSKCGLISELNITKQNQRVGVSVKMNNGQMARCIKWTDDNHFHIQYDDGTIVYMRMWSDFLNGKVIKKNEQRIGMSIRARNGQMMEIIEYKKWDDITVRFQDGTVVYNQRFEKFKNGEIVNPNVRIKTQTSINENYIQTLLAPYGFKKAPCGSLSHLGFGRMEIDCYNEELKVGIEYDGGLHRFRPGADEKKNGTAKKNGITLIRIRENLPKTNGGSIDFVIHNSKPINDELQHVMMEIIKLLNNKFHLNINPDIAIIKNKKRIINEIMSVYFNPHIGQTNNSKDGFIAQIVRYRGKRDIDIEFQDKTIKTITLTDFINGSFVKNKPPSPNLKTERIGEKIILNSGKVATVIKYNGYNDVDVQIGDCILYNKNYYNIKKLKL